METMRIFSGFPKHPHKVKIRNTKLHIELTEQDIYDYYEIVASDIVPYLKGRRTILFIATEPGSLIVRRNDPKTGEPFRINSVREFKELNNGSIVEWHPEVVKNHDTDFIFVDVDPRPKFPWKDTKKLAIDAYEVFKDSNKVKKVEIRFSGGRGFHVLGYLKRRMDVDDARELAKELLRPLETKRISISLPEGENTCRLDVTLLKYRGSLRAPWSLHSKTGLVCQIVDVKEVMSLEKEDFRIEEVI